MLFERKHVQSYPSYFQFLFLEKGNNNRTVEEP